MNIYLLYLLIEFSAILPLRHLRRADEPCGRFGRKEGRGRPLSLRCSGLMQQEAVREGGRETHRPKERRGWKWILGVLGLKRSLAELNCARH